MTLNLKYDQERIRKYHYFLLLSLIQQYKKTSRSELARITKMSNTTVGKIIRELIEDELVNEVGKTEGDLGRRATLLEINPQGAYIIGVEVNLNNIQIGIVTLGGKIIESKNIIYDAANQKPEEVLDQIAKNTLLIIDQVNLAIKKNIIAVGISIPGLVTWPEGDVLVVPQFHWKNIKVKEYLEKKLDYTVYVDNDVRTALLAESLFGSMVDFQNSTCLYLGSGVGGAVMLNGEILRGHLNMLGEIGHTTIEPRGALCDCGRLGCLQTFICSTDLEKKAQKPIQEIFSAYDLKEEWAIRLIDQARDYLGLAISNIVCIYNPEAVLITGPMVRDFPQIVEELEEITNRYIWSPLSDSYKIVLPSVGENSGVIGASAIVLKEFLRFSNDDI